MTVTTDTAPNSTTEGSDEAPVPGTWRGVLAPLSVFASSRDRRLLARPGDGVPRTRPLPLPLLYQDALAPGHEGGVPVGVIDRVWIEGDLLMGEGRFDMEDERAADVARKVHQNWLRFVSVDLDDDSHEIGCIGENRALVDCASYAASDDPEELPSHQGIVFSDWRLMGATLVSQPAFPEAFVSSYTTTAEVEGEPLTDTSALTAAAIGNTSLPFADRGRSWDAAAARKRIARWASSDGSGDKGKINWAKYGQAFLVGSGTGGVASADNIDECKMFSVRATRVSSAATTSPAAGNSATTHTTASSASAATKQNVSAARSRISTAGTADVSSRSAALSGAETVSPHIDGPRLQTGGGRTGNRTTTRRSNATGSGSTNDGTAPNTSKSYADSAKSKTASVRSVNIPSLSKGSSAGEIDLAPSSTTVTTAGASAGSSAGTATQGLACSATASTTSSEPWSTSAGGSREFADFKFPVADVIDGQLKIIWAAVVAAASVVQGGRGGTNAPTAGLKSKLTTLYQRAAKAFDDPEIKPPWSNGSKTAASLIRSSTTPLAVGQFAPDGWKPPAPWFNRPPFAEGTPWTVTGDRVFGHLAQWNVCHIGVEKRCIMAPPSQTGYAYYATRLLETKGGGIREVGIITMDTGHASLEALPAAATAHYDNTGTMAAVVCVGEDEFGIWCAGSLLPRLTDEERTRIQLSALSGDWRAVRGGMELVAALAVNVPGFPQTRARAGAQGSPFAAVGCGAVAQNADAREERAERVFAAERTARVQLAATRLTRSRIASMTKRMAAIGDAHARLGETAAATSAQFEKVTAAAGDDNQEGEADAAYHEELAVFFIEALAEPDILDACMPTDEEAQEYASVAEAEEFRRGNGKNWIEKTTTGHLPTYIRRVADHLMAKGMAESHAIAVAVNVVKKWCRGGAGGNPADGLNWPKTQHVTPKTRAQGCADVAHWETKRAETRAHSTSDANALRDAGVAS